MPRLMPRTHATNTHLHPEPEAEAEPEACGGLGHVAQPHLPGPQSVPGAQVQVALHAQSVRRTDLGHESQTHLPCAQVQAPPLPPHLCV